MLLVHELMHRQELDRRHAQRGEIVDGRRMRQTRVRAAQMLWNLVAMLAESLDVNFVDHRLVQLSSGRAVAAPVEAVVNDDRLRNIRRAVAVVALKIIAPQRIRKDRVIPFDVAADRPGVGIDQQLRRIAALPLRWIPWAVHAETVALAGTDPREIRVPAECGALRQPDAPFVTGVIEQTEIDGFGHL